MKKDVAPKNILIVEDEVMIGDLLCSFLEIRGYRTSFFDNTRDAYEDYSKNFYDLVVSDLSLPGEMTGFSFYNRLRDEYDAKVLIITGRDSAEVNSMGIESFLCKPFSLDVFESKVEDILRY